MANIETQLHSETHSLLLALVQVFGYREEKLDRLKLGTVAHVLQPLSEFLFSPGSVPVVKAPVPEAELRLWKFRLQLVLPLKNFKVIVSFIAYQLVPWVFQLKGILVVGTELVRLLDELVRALRDSEGGLAGVYCNIF